MHISTLNNSQLPVSAVTVRPTSFQKRYLATQPIPYNFVETSGRASSSGGVLRNGQCVWLDQAIQREHLTSSIRGFVESVGMIMVDPRRLKRGDGSL
jgi:hypothetical protein